MVNLRSQQKTLQVACALPTVNRVLTEAGYSAVTALSVVQAVITALVILLYQKAAQWLGDRWPNIEKVMLGSSARPHYEPRHAA